MALKSSIGPKFFGLNVTNVESRIFDARMFLGAVVPDSRD
jgi:hypothetical protein